MSARSLAGFKAHNTRLANRITALEREGKQLTLNLDNSLSDLVAGAIAQSNLTSFNPIVQNNIYAPLTINWTMLTYMYKTHGIIQTAIDMPVLDALRGGVEIESDELDGEDLKDLLDVMEKEGDLEVAGEAMTWARLYGGGEVVANTGQPGENPLDEKRLKTLAFYAGNRWELGSTTLQERNKPPMGPADTAPRESEFFNFYGVKLSRSRVFTLCGKAAPYIVRWQLQGWGMSEVERMVEAFNLWLKKNNLMYELLNEAKIDVYKLDGYKNNLATSAGTALVRRRIAMVNQLKNFQNALVLDKNDEYEQKQITFSGLAEVDKMNMMGIAAALRMPMTKIFGLSAAGFNSGEDDIENYNMLVESEVRQRIKPLLRWMIRLRMIQLFGAEFDFQIRFKPLRILSAAEEEQIRASKSTRLLADYDRGLLTSKEYADMSRKEGLITIETAASKGLIDDHPEVGGAFGEGGDEDGEGKDAGAKTGDEKKKSKESDDGGK